MVHQGTRVTRYAAKQLIQRIGGGERYVDWNPLTWLF